MRSTACSFSIVLADEEQVIETSALEPEALQGTWNRLAALTADKERQLAEQYHISIGHDGDVTSEEGHGRYSRRTYPVRVRSARLGELYALEYALSHSAPSHLVSESGNGHGVHVHFLKERRSCGVIAEWGFDRDNQPTIFIEPNYDKTPKGEHLELVLIHELAHNAEVRTGLDAYKPESWPLARKLGWLPFSNPDTGEKGWLICSNEIPSNYYKFAQLSGLWVRCNLNGQPLAENGRRVERQIEAARLTTKQMMERAEVRPATTYFNNPMEMYAEGMMMLRADKRHRHELAMINPSLYQTLKEQDQWEIDNTFSGRALIRNTDGVLVADGAEVRGELANFEVRAIAASPSNKSAVDTRLANANGAWTRAR